MKRGANRLLYVAVMACSATIGMGADVEAAPPERRPASLGMLVERLAESTSSVIAAERVAAAEHVSSASSLAQELVAAQLAIAEQNYERAAIHSLNLAENHPDTVAGRQAIYYLGVALMHLDMERWAVEQFTRVLRDASPEARRFHQRSVARLFDLAVPRRSRGFARQPGLSAMPELRSRLESVGAGVRSDLVRGVVSKSDAEKLERWARSFPEDSRETDLRYAYGRYLYLVGRPVDAQAEMDALNPLDIPMSRGGENARWRVRAAYIAAASSTAMGDLDDALLRFQLIAQARPQDDRDRQIVELSRMAVARIHQDRQEYEESIAAYRGMGRDSPLFKEVLYESAWALLGAKQFDQAIDVLDQLLAYGENSSVGIEIKQLRGKVKIQARDYPAAEEEFLALRAAFEAALHKLAPRLTHRADASAYFASVVGHEMEHFSLETLLPSDAVAIAQGLPAASAGRDLARETGALEREILEIRALLVEMEAAVAAPEKARLFNDLGAQAAALDHVESDLLEIREQLLLRLVPGSQRSRGAERQRKTLRARVDSPVLEGGLSRTRIVDWLNRISEDLADADRSIAASRAELVGLEFQFSARVEKLGEASHRTFFSEAQVLRDHIAELEAEAAGMRNSIRRTQMRLRFDDPQRGAAKRARKEYQAALLQMFQAQSAKSKAADVQTVWRRVDALAIRCDEARAQLEVAAEARLAGAREVLLEERANLDAYLDEMKQHRASIQQSVGEMLSAVFRDVVVELRSLVMRSEVGLLDVAWAMKEAEAGEATRLEKARDSDLRELDRSVELGLEAATP